MGHRRYKAEMASKEASAQESLAAARDEASSFQRMVEGQRDTIAGLEDAKRGKARGGVGQGVGGKLAYRFALQLLEMRRDEMDWGFSEGWFDYR